MNARESRQNTPLDLTAENITAYLESRPEYRGVDSWRCRALGGGVSNTVILVETPAERLVVKQALPQLRVKDEWLADRSRIFRERDVLIDTAKLLPPSWVPEVLWSDEPNYLFAMRAAAEPCEFWKNHLLAGRIEPEWARRAGLALGLTIRESWRSEFFERRYGDRTAFDQLRSDPYYGMIARRNPDIAPYVEEWLLQTAGYRVALVHGDWSPKNMLLTPGGMLFIDYECAHFGDPSFDSAFAINHLLLKAFHRPAWVEGYLSLARVFFTWTLSVLPADAFGYFEAATARHLGFLLLARVDGKSPVEYLTDERRRERVRQTAKKMIRARTERVETCLQLAWEGVLEGGVV